MRRNWVGGTLSGNIPKMFLPAAVLSEQASWKGTPAGLAARNVMAIGTRTVHTSSPRECSRAIGYHGEWKCEWAGCACFGTAIYVKIDFEESEESGVQQ